MKRFGIVGRALIVFAACFGLNCVGCGYAPAPRLEAVESWGLEGPTVYLVTPADYFP